MTDTPQGRYRIQGDKGQPCIAFLEIGRIGVEISEQEYRDRGYEPEFDELPWKIDYCPAEKKAGKDQ